jgi:hypothetical protein
VTTMGDRLQIVAILGTVALFLFVFELVRRRRLMERYALLWLFSAVILLALAAWKQGLARLSNAVGIYYPPSALFAVTLAFILVLLLHYSLVISRLADQNKILAQKLGALDQRIGELEATALEQGASVEPQRETLRS